MSGPRLIVSADSVSEEECYAWLPGRVGGETGAFVCAAFEFLGAGTDFGADCATPTAFFSAGTKAVLSVFVIAAFVCVGGAETCALAWADSTPEVAGTVLTGDEPSGGAWSSMSVCAGCVAFGRVRRTDSTVHRASAS